MQRKLPPPAPNLHLAVDLAQPHARAITEKHPMAAAQLLPAAFSASSRFSLPPRNPILKFDLPIPSCKRVTPSASAKSTPTGESLLAKADLLDLIADQERGIRTEGDRRKQSAIVAAINTLAAYGQGSVTTGPALTATWRMLWTTEKEQLFIIRNARVFGTEAGDVLQVIDIEKGLLNNVITFPPTGVFFVRSVCEAVSPQRVNFRFTSAVLRGKNWEIPLPPFGQGWFETVYLDEDIRVVKDIRADYLVVDRAPYSWTE